LSRPQESIRTGATYHIAEFINRNWDLMVGRTNEDVAQELGYKAANMISMWRTGKTRIPLEKLPDIARLMKLDIATLLPLWFEQYWGERKDAKPLLKEVFNRVASQREVPLLEALRAASPINDPHYEAEQIEAMTLSAFSVKSRAAAISAK
jgi:transcriptional regulator with XRE-family HTH domain